MIENLHKNIGWHKTAKFCMDFAVFFIAPAVPWGYCRDSLFAGEFDRIGQNFPTKKRKKGKWRDFFAKKRVEGVDMAKNGNYNRNRRTNVPN